MKMNLSAIQNVLTFIFFMGVTMFLLGSHALHKQALSSFNDEGMAYVRLMKKQERSELMMTGQSMPILVSSSLRILQYEVFEDPTTRQIEQRGEVINLSPTRSTLQEKMADPLLIKQAHQRVMAVRYEAPVTSWYRLSMEYELREKAKREEGQSCEPMHEWQNTVYPSCNSVHELNMHPDSVSGNFNFINCGSARCTFSIKSLHEDDQGGVGEDMLVLKIPK
jgi:hypothetical protein